MTDVLYHLRAEREFLQRLREENKNKKLESLITTLLYHNARAIDAYCAVGKSIVEEIARMEQQSKEKAS